MEKGEGGVALLDAAGLPETAVEGGGLERLGRWPGLRARVGAGAELKTGLRAGLRSGVWTGAGPGAAVFGDHEAAGSDEGGVGTA